jgi:hypothetical protein
MPREIDFQTMIINSVRRDGGYGSKWSSSVQIGKPDLILVHHRIGSAFVEVKKEELGKLYTMSRELKVTPKQENELKMINDAGGLGMVMVVIDGGHRDRYLVALPHDADRIEWPSRYPHVKFGVGGYVDVVGLCMEYKRWRTEQ